MILIIFIYLILIYNENNMLDNGSPAKILVVDDEPDLELLISQKFRKKVKQNEFEFSFANNGKEALKKLETGGVDVVLTDINMPEMDGLTLVSRLREDYPLLKSVIVSAYGDIGNIRKALNYGAFDFLTKPIDFEDLEITINKTINEVSALKKAVVDREKLKLLHRELDVACKIQSSMVPSLFPPFPHRDEIDLFAEMIPAKHVGGDLYDYFFIDEYHLFFVTGDVSGKGVPAALFMALSKTLIKAVATKGMPPHVCMDEVNKIINMENETSMFVTVFAGVLNTFTGEIVYCNCGHNLPYIMRSGGKAEKLQNTDGIALGISTEEINFTARKIMLMPGDSVLLYTDGVTEATNAQEELFGESRLHDLLNNSANMTPEDVVKKLIKEVKDYTEGLEQSDDITVLCLKYL